MPIFEYSNVVGLLRKALSGTLPGVRAQSLMTPRPLRANWVKDLEHLPSGIRDAAVLLLTYPRAETACLTLTRRTGTVESHRMQISFPGGALEAGETIEEGALREAQEEIGLAPERVEILGRLTPLHVPVSRFLVHPVVGTVTALPRLRKDPAEVAAILEAPVERLMKPETVTWLWKDHPRGERLVPYFRLERDLVWGATAMILSELLHILGWQGPPEPPEETSAD
jgi:8-oxo-dGTP pyrophosphatase MutT (NUDIX family)